MMFHFWTDTLFAPYRASLAFQEAFWHSMASGPSGSSRRSLEERTEASKFTVIDGGNELPPGVVKSKQ